jgi:hypothetical protein
VDGSLSMSMAMNGRGREQKRERQRQVCVCVEAGELEMVNWSSLYIELCDTE